MYIDITQDPPADILRTKRKYQRLIPILLALISCAILLALYLVFFGSPHEELLENIALALFVGPGLIFFYYAEKLHDYKTLSPKQEKKVAEFSLQAPDVAAYCDKVSMMGRKLIKAEYDAFKSRIEDL